MSQTEVGAQFLMWCFRFFLWSFLALWGAFWVIFGQTIWPFVDKKLAQKGNQKLTKKLAKN
jgi:hypothetical protein